MDELLRKASDLAYREAESTGMPIKLHIDLARDKAIELAKRLGADPKIVEAGSLLMDCMIGRAIRQNKLHTHVEMSLEAADKIMQQCDLTEEEKENVRSCIREHHGGVSFTAKESEICCNADCYRFTSVAGFFYAVRYLHDMPTQELVKLLRNKFEEKKDALTLDVCKNELKDDIRLIDSFIEELDKQI